MRKKAAGPYVQRNGVVEWREPMRGGAPMRVAQTSPGDIPIFNQERAYGRAAAAEAGDERGCVVPLDTTCSNQEGTTRHGHLQKEEEDKPPFIYSSTL